MPRYFSQKATKAERILLFEDIAAQYGIDTSNSGWIGQARDRHSDELKAASGDGGVGVHEIDWEDDDDCADKHSFRLEAIAEGITKEVTLEEAQYLAKEVIKLQHIVYGDEESERNQELRHRIENVETYLSMAQKALTGELD